MSATTGEKVVLFGLSRDYFKIGGGERRAYFKEAGAVNFGEGEAKW